MIFFRVLLYGLIFYFPLLMFYDGYRYAGILPKENVLWYQNFNDNPRFNLDQTISKFPTFKRQYYQGDQLLAYFNERGEVIHKIFVDRQSLISAQNNGYVFFQKFGDMIHFIDRLGRKKWSLTTFSYPYLSPLNNNILLITTDNTSISMVDRNQNKIMNLTYIGTMITGFSFCSYNDSFVLGTIDGKIYYFNAKAEKIFERAFLTSRFSYIKSVACSLSGNKVAVLSGLKPEKLILMDQEGNILWEQPTGTERRTKISLEIDERNQMLYDRRGGKIAMMSLEDGNLVGEIELKADPKEIRYTLFSSDEDFLLVGNSSAFSQIITLYSLTGEIKWERTFPHQFLQYIEVKKEGSLVYLLIILDSSVYTYRLTSS